MSPRTMSIRTLQATTLSALLSLGLASAVACHQETSDPPLESDGGVRADGGTRTDASPLGDASDDATLSSPDAALDSGEPPVGRVPVFVAQGHAGRTVRSCDGGERWIDDQSQDGAIRCFTDGFDCDHHPGAGKGIVYGREHFFATFGWGSPGGVFRSEDGVRWEPLLEATTYGGIGFGSDALVVGARNARRSTDQGATWSEEISTMLEGWNVRRMAWVPVGAASEEGRFVVVGDGDGGPDVVLSSDGGRSWWHPERFPKGQCGNGVQTSGGIVSGNGAIVIVGSDGQACRSTDEGRTFTATRVADGIGSQAVFDGERFWVWSRGAAFRSADGASWQRVTTEPGDVEIGPVAFHPALGRFVGVRGGWQNWYERQVFWHSEDGVRWTVAASFEGGHPIRFVAEGWAPAASCP